MKSKSILTVCLIAVTTAFFISSCQKEMISPAAARDIDAKAKEPVWRAYKDSFDSYYFVVPDFANGAGPSTNFLPAWFPGGGTGNATHMGRVSSYFNQYTSVGPDGLGSVPASVTMFFETELAAAGITGIPNNVNNITYDNKGNSVWFQGGNNTSTPISPTRINFTGTASIVGGTGKFVHATGTITLNGYFNPQDPSDASFWTEGKIKY